MHYYERHPFSAIQRQHASERILFLVQTKRFFLHNANERDIYRDEDYALHPEVFAEAIALNAAHIEAHRDARQAAQTAIAQFEANNRIVSPKVPKNGNVVDYSRYGGGFEICRVYPLAAFAPYVPKSLDILVEKVFQQNMGTKTADDIAPKALRVHREHAEDLAAVIWKQLQAIDASNPNNNRCLVLMQSRISLNSFDDKGDFADSRVWDMQDFPFAVGFLLYEYSKEYRMAQHNFIVCSTIRTSHVRVEHWSKTSDSGEVPRISYFNNTSYSNSVLFASVL